MTRFVKFIQLNIYKGKFLNKIVDFLKEEKPDFASLEEVTRGSVNFWKDKSIDTAVYIKEALRYEEVYNYDFQVKNPPGAFGLAVLSRFPIKRTNILRLREPQTVEFAKTKDKKWFPLIPRQLLDSEVDYQGTDLHIMTWHGAWTPTPADTEETLRQARLVSDYLRGTSKPFILGVDANALPESKTISLINKVANNLMTGAGVKYTTNPKIHKARPKAFPIDFIFTSHHFKLISLKVPQITISDHFPVIAQLEF